MKVFMDLEFTGLHQKTSLISIGMIAENEATFYGELVDYDKSQVDSWIEKNVIANLLFKEPNPLIEERRAWSWSKINNNVEAQGTKNEIARDIDDWFQSLLGGRLGWVDYEESKTPQKIETPQIEIWSDCYAYDWVLFCELFGGALKIPKCVYYIPFDLASYMKIVGIDPDINREEFAGLNKEDTTKHNALFDVKVIKMCYEKLESLKGG